VHTMTSQIILMIDEFGKSNPAVKLALLRMMLERKIGSYTLHPESIVFATTNLGGEGVGDLLPAHACNRLTVIESIQANVGAVDRVGYQQRYRSYCVGVVSQQRQGVR
jgi:MoxR-like ATPase